MKKFIIMMISALVLVAGVAEAKGGFSSGGGRGSFSSSSSRSFSSGSSYRSSSSSYSSPRTSSTTTVNRTVTRYSAPMGSYGGMGMGYGYSNGMLTGLIIGNMMHPQGTVMYGGPGAYSNNALLYPNGQVVDQSGQVVGNYANGQFTAVQNGPIVAQQVPADAFQKSGPSVGDIILIVLFGTLAFIALIIILALIFA